MRLPLIFALAIALVLSGCGGGNSSSLSGGNGSSAGGGNSSNGSGQVIAGAGPNVQAISVDTGPTGVNAVDIPYTSVTVCTPGSATACTTIDHIEVDTGSYGLRIMASTLPASVDLPQETDATGASIVECAQFSDGYSWGPVKRADVHISGETAADVPIQVIGDAAFPASGTPADCSSAGPAENDVVSFGANGILGVGPFAEDCGALCATNIVQGTYYSCSSAVVCKGSTASLTEQVVNPVALFATDNNGVIVELPPVPDAGEATLTGALVFGIDTEGNNDLGNATVLTGDPYYGSITTDYKGASYSNSFIDSGSNADYFHDNTLSLCSNSGEAPGFFCPSSTVSLSATNTGMNSAGSTVSFNVANAASLFTAHLTYAAFGQLGAPNSDPTSFDWGLPFFFGHNVYTAIDGRNTSGGLGPYFAY